MNLFKSLVFTDKGIDDLTTAAGAGKTIEIKRGVLCGYNPPDDNQVYNPYRDASGVLDVDAVKSNINKYFAKSEALKATTTPTPYIEGIVRLKTVKKDNQNILSFALDFENTDFDHDVAVKFFGYESWAALIASEKELASDCKCLALLAQDDAGLEYIFAFAKLASGQQLQYPLALTEELTHHLHVDLFISINQSDNIVIKYTPDGFVEYNEFAQHVANAEDVYAKKIDVYTKVESDNSFLTKSDAAATYTTKTENAKKANSSDVYTKIESDDKFLTKVEAAQKADKTSVYTKTETYPTTQLYTQAEVNELLSAHLIQTTNDIEKYQLSSIPYAKKGNYFFYKDELIPDWIKNYNLTYFNRCTVEIVVQGYIRSYTNNEAFVRLTAYRSEDKAVSYYGWGTSNENMKWYDSQGNRVNSK